MTTRREALLVAVAASTLYLSGIGDGIPFYTRGEPREGVVVREMLRSGDWVLPARGPGEPARKPPLYYWLAAASLRLLPAEPETALRLPSAGLATAAVLGIWATARAVSGPAAGLPAALVLATSFEWMRAATSARVDMTLAATLAAMLGGWLVALSQGRRWGLLLAAAGGAAGTLAKGPVALLIPAIAVSMFWLLHGEAGAWRRLRPLLVLPLAVAGATTWYAVALAREGSGFLALLARENVLRFLDTEAAGTGHAHAAGYLVVLGLVGLLPWTPLLPLALAPLRARPRAPAALLAALWIAAGVLVFCLAAAKRSVYLLPLYPAIALLVGMGAASEAGTARVTARVYAPALVLLAALVAAFALGLDPGAVLHRWLRPEDAVGAAALAAAAHAAAPALGLLALVTAAAVVPVAGAVRAARWRTLTLLVGGIAAAWTVGFNLLIHPAIAAPRSMRAFLEQVGHALPEGTALHALFPFDPAVRFYAPKPLTRWNAGGGHLLLWEEDWRRLRDQAGRPLRVLAVSDAARPGRGRLTLVLAPAGRLRPAAADATGPPRPPGLRTGS